MKILIADDHAVVRRGLQQILADEFDVVEFGEAADAGEAGLGEDGEMLPDDYTAIASLFLGS